MHAWEAIRKTLDYIEENLAEEIQTEKLANTAALSLFYYQRLFSRLVKKPVGEYIKLRRLAGACKVLDNKDNRIIDVALDYGFGSHETFTRAFKEVYGLTPSEYRDNPVMLNHFIKPDLLLGYVMIDEGVPLISDGIVLEINRKTLEEPLYFLGISDFVRIENQIPLGEATGVDQPGEIWARFHKVKHKIKRKPNGQEFGAAFAGDALKGYFSYYAGAEVETETEQDGFISWEMSAQEYFVCGFEAETFEELVTSALYKATNFYYSWLNKRGLSENGFVTEHYFKNGADAPYMELWFPIKKNS